MIWNPGLTEWLQTIGNDDQLRMRIVESILSELSQTNEGLEVAPLFMWGCPLLTRNDFNWLADQLEQDVNHERQAVLAQWLRRLGSEWIGRKPKGSSVLRRRSLPRRSDSCPI